jgi:hypothetical protein
MNNKDFDAFVAISGMEPHQTEEPTQKKTASRPSDNFFDAPTYRGENQQDLTEDERRAETTERSEIDELTSKQNLSDAIATAGVGLTLTITVNAAAGGSGAAMGLGLGLIGCLTFGVEAASGKKSGLVRLGAMGLGTAYGLSQLWGAYSQESGKAELNRAVELAEIPRQEQPGGWREIGETGGAIILLFALLLIVCQPFRNFVNRLLSGK